MGGGSGAFSFREAVNEAVRGDHGPHLEMMRQHGLRVRSYAGWNSGHILLEGPNAGEMHLDARCPDCDALVSVRDPGPYFKARIRRCPEHDFVIESQSGNAWVARC